MTVINCISLPAPPELPELEIPQFGILQAARNSLYDLPDFSAYVMSMQNLASNALAPLRRFLEMIEVILAIKNCVQSIIDALLPPSPGPIIECIKGLVVAIARLTSFFPPFEYVKTALSLMKYIKQVIDEIISLFVLLDQRITTLKNNIELALEMGDLELASINDCASNVTPIVINAMDLLKFISPLMSIIVEPIARLVPIPILRDKLALIGNLPAEFAAAQADIEGTPEIPALGELLEIIAQVGNIAVVIYNALAPVVGRSSDLTLTTMPTLVNF